MENLRLSWDLFVIVFFGVIIAYSFIIGRNQTLKIIIATYMAILTADGLGNLFQTYLLPTAPSLQGTAGLHALALVKIFTFVIVIVLLAVKGGFQVSILEEKSAMTHVVANLTFGFLNAGLMISVLLVYMTGGSFVLGTTQDALQGSLYQESRFIQAMIDNYNLWFSLPAIAIVIVSFLQPHEH
ncbi:MAG: hypothetical protein WC846_03735 [Candidatus Gracilibacteria bacterium]|jgi:hypothetical protein